MLNFDDDLMFIDGQCLSGSGSSYQSLNPYDGQVLWQGLMASEQDCLQAVRSSLKAFKEWSKISIVERMSYLEQFSSALQDSQAELAQLISLESGQALWQAQKEIKSIVLQIPMALKSFQLRCGQVRSNVQGLQSVVRFRPHGPLLVTSQDGLAAYTPSSYIIPALLAGNTVIFKPNEHTPLVGAFLAKLWQKSGLPAGVINVLPGDDSLLECLMQHDDLQGVCFNGFYEQGCEYHRKFAGRPDKIMALELANDNPLIVWDVENPQLAAYYAMQSTLLNGAQRSLLARRIIVDRSSAQTELFVQALVDLFGSLNIGAGNSEPEVYMGSLMCRDNAEKLCNFEQTLKSQGAQSLLDLSWDKTHSAVLKPGLIDVSCLDGSQLAPVYGPLVQLIYVDSFSQAIERANQAPYGFAAGILSQNKQNYLEALYSLHCSLLNWNQVMGELSAVAPMGGLGLGGQNRPSSFIAADYCSYPVSSLEQSCLSVPPNVSPGVNKAKLSWISSCI